MTRAERSHVFGGRLRLVPLMERTGLLDCSMPRGGQWMLGARVPDQQQTPAITRISLEHHHPTGWN